MSDKNTLVDPGFMVERPDGSVIADPSKIPAPQEAQAPASSERPEWLDEKFKSPEDLAKAYKELETKLGQKAPETKPETPALTPESVKEKGFDLAALQAEFNTKGELSADTLKALEAKGITKEAVNQYVEGVKAQAAQVRTEFSKLAGGDEQLASVLEWAKTGLSADEIAGYDALLDSGNHAAAKIAFQGIVARYTAENGETPTLVEAARVPSTPGVKPFASSAEVVAAMNDKRYATDPAYRKKVEQRLAVSDY